MNLASSTRAAENRVMWKGIVAKSSMVSQTAMQGYGLEQTV